MGGTIGNGISPRHTAGSGGGIFTNITKGKVTAEGTAGFTDRGDRMRVGEINIIKGNRAGIG